MRKHRILPIITLLCLFAADGGAATPPVSTEPPAEPDTLRLDTPKAAPASPIAPPAGAERAIRGNPLWSIPLRELNATRERPLFAPSRRAPPPVVANAPRLPAAAAAEKPPEPEPLQLSLVGTVAGEKGGLGVFLDKASGTPLRLKVGEVHKGWTLRSVGRRDVVLAKGLMTTKLAMVTEPAKSKGPDPAKLAPPAQASAPPQSPAKARGMEAAGAAKYDPAAFSLFKLVK